MKAITLTLLAILVAYPANAWVALEKYNPNGPNLTSHCYLSQSNVGALNKGETKRLEGQCAIATCRDDRDVVITGCGVYVVKPPCYILDGDLQKPFPECCYELKCLGESSNNKV